MKTKRLLTLALVAVLLPASVNTTVYAAKKTEKTKVESLIIQKENVTNQPKVKSLSANTKNKWKKNISFSENNSNSQDDIKLLSALIYCEAGSESYSGKLAVGIVVMNRIKSSRYPSSLKGVIYQQSQFGPASNGSLSRALSNYENGDFTSSNQKECIKAAKEALDGTTSVTINGQSKSFSSYLYFNGSSSSSAYKLGCHYFR